MTTLDLRGSSATLQLATNGGTASLRGFLGVGPQGPAGPPGASGTGGTGGTATSVVGVDTDGVPFFDPAGVTGGTTVQADTDGVPYFV